jgi:hypothetical protein
MRFRADLLAYLDRLPVGELADLRSELPSRPSLKRGRAGFREWPWSVGW